ncbi:MAG: hypothetical protein HW405_732 [Candidatus Berkelbacteria bacterium]|nr:hypothetical protein [Candidatus Berkelbacteria bacterium]
MTAEASAKVFVCQALNQYHSSRLGETHNLIVELLENAGLEVIDLWNLVTHKDGEYLSWLWENKERLEAVQDWQNASGFEEDWTKGISELLDRGRKPADVFLVVYDGQIDVLTAIMTPSLWFRADGQKPVFILRTDSACVSCQNTQCDYGVELNRLCEGPNDGLIKSIERFEQSLGAIRNLGLARRQIQEVLASQA